MAHKSYTAVAPAAKQGRQSLTLLNSTSPKLEPTALPLHSARHRCARVIALGQKDAGRVHHHPAAVVAQAEPVHLLRDAEESIATSWVTELIGPSITFFSGTTSLCDASIAASQAE